MQNRQTYYRPTLNFSISQFQKTIQLELDQHKQFAHLFPRYQDESYIAQATSFDPEEKKHIRLFYQIIKKFKVIRPESTFLLFWNLLIMIIITMNFYEIPISMFFTNAVYYAQFNSALGITLNVFFITALFVNVIVVRPITAYYEEGKLIASRKLILKRYLKLQFWFNIISWVALLIYAVSYNPFLIYLKLLFYLTAFSLQQTSKLINYKLELWRIRFTIFKIFRLLLFVFFIVLWLAGIFFAIDYYYYERKEYYPVNLWLTNSVCSQYADSSYINLIQTYEWYVWLNYSVYWALQTISTLGYGDITPRNPIQVIYCDIVIILVCIVYAFFLSEVWQIFFELYAKEISYKNKTVKYFERNYKLNRQMVTKLQNYLYTKQRQKQKEQNQIQINENLSDQLKLQLILARQKKQYVSIPFFNHLSIYDQQYAQLLSVLGFRTIQARYGQNQIIFSNKFVNVSLYLLSLGQVKLHYKNSKVSTILKDHDKSKVFFGVINFLLRKHSSYEAKALKFSKISELSEQDFLTAIKQSSKIKVNISQHQQKYHQLSQELKIYRNFALCGQSCWICSETSHETSKCPQIFKQILLYKNFQGKKNAQLKKKNTYRQYFKRKAYKTKKISISLIGLIMNKYVFNLVDVLEERNVNKVDQVKNFLTYRLSFNI